jgi:hypothetical protein
VWWRLKSRLRIVGYGYDFVGVMILLEFYAVLIEESLTAKKHRNVRIYEYDGSIKLLRLILYPKRQVTNKAVDWFHRNAHDGSASAGGSIYLERLCDRGFAGNFIGVRFTSRNKGVAITDAGKIFYTEDEGASGCASR